MSAAIIYCSQLVSTNYQINSLHYLHNFVVYFLVLISIMSTRVEEIKLDYVFAVLLGIGDAGWMNHPIKKALNREQIVRFADFVWLTDDDISNLHYQVNPANPADPVLPLPMMDKKRIKLVLCFYHFVCKQMKTSVNIMKFGPDTFNAFRLSDDFVPLEPIKHWNTKTADTTVTNWKKNVTPKKQDFPEFKNEIYWVITKKKINTFYQAYGLEHLVDPLYVPTNDELHRLQQAWLFSVFQEKFKESMAKTIVLKYEDTMDNVLIWTEMCDYYDSSAVRDKTVGKVSAFLTSTVLSKLSWTGTYKDFLLLYKNQTMVYNELADAPYQDSQLNMFLHNCLIGTPLQEVYTNLKATARATKTPFNPSFNEYLADLIAKAADLDTDASGKKMNHKRIGNIHDLSMPTDEDDTTPELDIFDINLHNFFGNDATDDVDDDNEPYGLIIQAANSTRAPTTNTLRREPMMNLATWKSLSPTFKKFWDATSDDDKKKLLTYAATHPYRYGVRKTDILFEPPTPRASVSFHDSSTPADGPPGTSNDQMTVTTHSFVHDVDDIDDEDEDALYNAIMDPVAQVNMDICSVMSEKSDRNKPKNDPQATPLRGILKRPSTTPRIVDVHQIRINGELHTYYDSDDDVAPPQPGIPPLRSHEQADGATSTASAKPSKPTEHVAVNRPHQKFVDEYVAAWYAKQDQLKNTSHTPPQDDTGDEAKTKTTSTTENTDAKPTAVISMNEVKPTDSTATAILATKTTEAHDHEDPEDPYDGLTPQEHYFRIWQERNPDAKIKESQLLKHETSPSTVSTLTPPITIVADPMIQSNSDNTGSTKMHDPLDIVAIYNQKPPSSKHKPLRERLTALPPKAPKKIEMNAQQEMNAYAQALLPKETLTAGDEYTQRWLKAHGEIPDTTDTAAEEYKKKWLKEHEDGEALSDFIVDDKDNAKPPKSAKKSPPSDAVDKAQGGNPSVTDPKLNNTTNPTDSQQNIQLSGNNLNPSNSDGTIVRLPQDSSAPTDAEKATKSFAAVARNTTSTTVPTPTPPDDTHTPAPAPPSIGNKTHRNTRLTREERRLQINANFEPVRNRDTPRTRGRKPNNNNKRKHQKSPTNTEHPVRPNAASPNQFEALAHEHSDEDVPSIGEIAPTEFRRTTLSTAQIIPTSTYGEESKSPSPTSAQGEESKSSSPTLNNDSSKSSSFENVEMPTGPTLTMPVETPTNGTVPTASMPTETDHTADPTTPVTYAQLEAQLQPSGKADPTKSDFR